MLDSQSDGSLRSVQAPGRDLAILAMATVLCLVPFLNKALNIDDPVYVWCAKQIQSHPLDCYGFNVNWFWFERPMYEENKNPPLVGYFLALAAAILGFSEVALHSACMLPAIGCITGTYWLARSFCRHPVSAALITLTTPLFLVSATTVMSDVLMLCCWIWSLVTWQWGLESRNRVWFASSAVLIALAALTKYPGVNLIPLLAVYTVASDRRLTWKLLWLLLPLVVLAGYEWWSRQAYGVGLFSDATSFITLGIAPSQAFLDAKLLVALSFVGGLLISGVFYLPGILSRWMLIICVLVWAVVSINFATMKAPNEYFHFVPQQTFSVLSAIQMGLFVTAGLAIVGLSVTQSLKIRSPQSLLLVMWILGTLTFAGFVNWTCNGRSLLPIAPAFGILIVCCLEDAAQNQSNRIGRWQWALLPSLAISLMVAWADVCLANSARTAAAAITADYQDPGRTIWFQGHWGFQYYMQQLGGKPIDVSQSPSHAGDLLITPYNNTAVNLNLFKPGSLKHVRTLEFSACPWLSTQHKSVGAGFYSSLMGPMPYVFGQTPAERYEVWQFNE